uniref:SH3 and multiple ankyrin repeat domains protein 2 n=1 Tax=Sphaerodactylus townsendi TaxID=933632 RepID=A0ACB8G3W1_9SAUR
MNEGNKEPVVFGGGKPSKPEEEDGATVKSISIRPDDARLDSFPWLGILVMPSSHQRSSSLHTPSSCLQAGVTWNKTEFTEAQKSYQSAIMDQDLCHLETENETLRREVGEMPRGFREMSCIHILPEATLVNYFKDCLDKEVLQWSLEQGITEEERQFLAPPMLKFTRSLSMPDTSEDIPPPPQSLPPTPPPPSPSLYNSPKSPMSRIYGTIKPAFNQNSVSKIALLGRSENMGTVIRDKGIYYRRELDRYSLDSEDLYSRNAATQASFRNKRGQMPENPYSEVGKIASKAVYVPAKPARRKGMLVKQSNVEDSPEKTCSIPIPTIIVKEPSTSSSGKSSQGSSMEIDSQPSEQPGQLRPEDNLSGSSPFAAAIAGAVRDREKRLEARRNSPAFLSTDLGDEDVGLTPPTPRMRQSKFTEEGMFDNEDNFSQLVSPSPIPAPREPENNFNSKELNNQSETRTPSSSAPTAVGSENNALAIQNTGVASLDSYVHPLTGKLLDPNSPLALALSARDRAMKEQTQQTPGKGESGKSES